MVEVNTYKAHEIAPEKKSQKKLFICDESSITCANLKNLQSAIEESGGEVVLAMPNIEYQKGKRGWAKVNILASLCPNITGIIPMDYDLVFDEISGGEWKDVFIYKDVMWISAQSVNSDSVTGTELKIIRSHDPFDKRMIERTREVVKESNCWLDPAGAVFVKDARVLVEATSTSFNNSHCKEIPLSLEDLKLDSGERMLFCDSLHAERVGISKAAKAGLSLDGSTMYITKFPCRPCAQSVIASGVKTIVFEKGSYGLSETGDLFTENEIVLKKVSLES